MWPSFHRISPKTRREKKNDVDDDDGSGYADDRFDDVDVYDYYDYENETYNYRYDSGELTSMR